MTREEEIKQEIRRQVARAGDELHGFRVFLFGSRVTGTARPRSDFDVGVIGPGPLNSRTFFRIADLLDEIDTLYRIDWVDMNQASPQFREQAMQHTEVLYDAEQTLAVYRELPRFLPLLQTLIARLTAEGGGGSEAS